MLTEVNHGYVCACIVSRAYYGNINFFGGPSTTSVKVSAKLKQLEEENEDAMFVIVSDVWLDSVEVMEKLNVMFSGLNLQSVQVESTDSRKPSHLVTVCYRICCHASHLFHFLWKLFFCPVWENTSQITER